MQQFILQHPEKITFDPTNKKHRSQFAMFLRSGKWESTVRGCPFKLEWPFLTIPDMCKNKLVQFYTSQDPELQTA